MKTVTITITVPADDFSHFEDKCHLEESDYANALDAISVVLCSVLCVSSAELAISAVYEEANQ